MSRFPQSKGARGSLKWIQRLVNERPDQLDGLILKHLPHARSIDWRSPRADDGFAEYRDEAFLERLGVGELSGPLKDFWPARGPQWDALGVTDQGDLLIVEAKAHIPELFSPSTQASPESRRKIDVALDNTAKLLRANPAAPWTNVFFQYANRLAHLNFLRVIQNRPAWLVFVYIVGDNDIKGPTTAAEWQGALRVVRGIMGISERNRLAPYVIEVFPDVTGLDRSFT